MPPTEMNTETNRENVISELNDLIALDHDAIAAYEAAIERLDDTSIAKRFEEFKQDHQRHVRDLSGAVSTLGATPHKGGDMKKILTKGKVVLAGLGSDKQILQAMKSNEDQTVAKYDAAVRECTTAAPTIREMLARGLEDERRHRAWIEERLAKL